MTTVGHNAKKEIARFSIRFEKPIIDVPDASTRDTNWDIQNGGSQISLSLNDITICGSAPLSPLESFLSLGPIGEVVVRSFFQALKQRSETIPISEIVSIEVYSELLDGSSSGRHKQPPVDIVQIFTDETDKGRRVFSFSFNNIFNGTPRSTLWQFWVSLGTILPPDRLIIHTNELKQAFKYMTAKSDPVADSPPVADAPQPKQTSKGKSP